MLRSTKTLAAGSYEAARVIDTIELDFEDRRRRRGTLEASGGTAFLVDLAEAPTLLDGDAFELETGDIIAIAGKPERLVEFRSTDPHVITRVAWHLGNRHTPTQLLPDALRIRDDYVLVELVKKLGADVGFVTAAFQPEGGAYGLGGVTGHDHGHGHDHHDDHDHHGHHDHDHHDHAHHDHKHHAHEHHAHDHHDHGHDRAHDAPAAPQMSEEDRLMAETIARREARRAARAETRHVHGPNCGHDHHDHGHDHNHDHHGHDHGHGHDHHDHAHHDHAHHDHADHDHAHEAHDHRH